MGVPLSDRRAEQILAEYRLKGIYTDQVAAKGLNVDSLKKRVNATLGKRDNQAENSTESLGDRSAFL